MYMVVRRYTGASTLVDVMVQREQEIRDLITSVHGFKAYYAARAGDGIVATITICDDLEGTTESSRRAAEWVWLNIPGASVSLAEITEGETFLSF